MLSDSVTLIQALLRGHVEALPTVLELTNANKVQQLLDGKVDAIQVRARVCASVLVCACVSVRACVRVLPVVD
jgi:hypothetical protein